MTNALGWLNDARERSGLHVEQVRLSECRDWELRAGALIHASGRFFAIRGLCIESVDPAWHGRLQPMIDQPEMGWLGFLVRPRPGAGIEWLLQAKTEPGSVGGTQIAPTIQATRSNYSQAHGGLPTRFLDVFRSGRFFLSDAPYSEQGSRFLWKFNRNSVLMADPCAEDQPNWSWCASDELRACLGASCVVNTDARSVIATAPWSLLAGGGPLFSSRVLRNSYRRAGVKIPAILGRMRRLSRPRSTLWHFVDLARMDGWELDEMGLRSHASDVVVTCHRTRVADREVGDWCQPFLSHRDGYECVLLLRVKNDEVQVLVTMTREAGLADRAEFAPSLQSAVPAGKDLTELCRRGRELVAIRQSDEGGRFMKAMTDYRIVLVPADAAETGREDSLWVNMATLELLARTPASMNNELRTLVSLLLSRQTDEAMAKF